MYVCKNNNLVDLTVSQKASHHIKMKLTWFSQLKSTLIIMSVCLFVT